MTKLTSQKLVKAMEGDFLVSSENKNILLLCTRYLNKLWDIPAEAKNFWVNISDVKVNDNAHKIKIKFPTGMENDMLVGVNKGPRTIGITSHMEEFITRLRNQALAKGKNIEYCWMWVEYER